jgi:hypothetical protein
MCCKINLKNGMWGRGDWFLHHDNAPAHSALSVCKFLAKNKTVIPHPPFSPDLVMCYFFLFPKLKVVLQGSRLNNVTMVQANCERHFLSFKQLTSGNTSNGGATTKLAVYTKSYRDYFEENSTG